MYGVLDRNGCHNDISKTERGAKNFATRNGYNHISKRLGYNAYKYAEKVAGKWVKVEYNFDSYTDS